LVTLARRHYENEIDYISNFAYYMENPQNPYSGIETSESRMRMPIEKERELVRKFSNYADMFGDV
jgi:phosphoribosylglycinamide formyltransferase-1